MISAHPGLPEFDYIRPKSLAEASRFLADHPGEARPFLGGTDVFVRMRDGVWKEKYLVDVKNLDGMTEIRFDPEIGLNLGAAVNMNKVAASSEIRKTTRSWYRPARPLPATSCGPGPRLLATSATLHRPEIQPAPAWFRMHTCTSTAWTVFATNHWQISSWAPGKRP
jgi:hypothetical protein